MHQPSHGTYRRAAAALAMTWVALGFAGAAQAKGVPDLNGIWVIAEGFMDKQDGTSPSAPGRPETDAEQIRVMFSNQPSLKGEYLARMNKVMASQMSGKPIEDRGALCLPQGMPGFWGGPYAFEIIQTPKQLNLFQEWNEQTRRIYLDGRKHPEDADPTYNGHSIGHWEGQTLVVDTAQIREDTLIGLAGSHSDAIRITERFTFVAPDRLNVEMTVMDDKALTKPWVSTVHLHRKGGMEIAEYVCAENNRNPVGADGLTQAILKP